MRPFPSLPAGLLALMLLATGLGGGEEPSEQAQAAPLERSLYRAAAVHIGDGRVLRPGEMLVEDGVVARVAEAVPQEAWAEGPAPELHDLGAVEMTPGLVDAAAVVDAGGGAASWRAADAYDPFESLASRLLEIGVTSVCLFPEGGTVPGRAALVALGPDRLETLDPEVGLVWRLDESSPDRAAAAILDLERRLGEGTKYADAWEEYEKSRSDEEKGRKRRGRGAKGKEPEKPRLDPDKEVWGRVARGELPLLARLDGAQAARALRDRLAPRELPVTLFGCARCEAGLGAPVVLMPLAPRVEIEDEAAAPRPRLARELVDEGEILAMGTGGPWPASSLWILGAVSASGLSEEAALATVTGGAAQALGVDDRVGLLAPGRRADFLVWEGSPMAPASRPRAVFLGGRVWEGAP